MPRKKRGKQKPHNNEKEPRGASEIEKATLSISDIEFASLRDDVLSRYRPVKEIIFAGKPFVPPRAYRRMHQDRPASTR